MNIFRLRLQSEAHPRWKNGQPPYSTTGAERASWIHVEARGVSASPNGFRGSISDHREQERGKRQREEIQNRRRISANSALSSSVAPMSRGSRAIPQIGHAPGPARTISGCIGHV